MLSNIEKTYAKEKLEITREKLFTELNGLSQAQLVYKPDAETWSITETMEHIAVSENGIWQVIRQGLTRDADESRRNEILLTDEAVYNRTASRDLKLKSPDVITPAGKFPNTEASLAFFAKRRNSTIEYVNAAEDDLRNRYWKHPFAGLIDLYQTILFIAGHCARHTEQIAELKQSSAFPRQ